MVNSRIVASGLNQKPNFCQYSAAVFRLSSEGLHHQHGWHSTGTTPLYRNKGFPASNSLSEPPLLDTELRAWMWRHRCHVLAYLSVGDVIVVNIIGLVRVVTLWRFFSQTVIVIIIVLITAIVIGRSRLRSWLWLVERHRQNATWLYDTTHVSYHRHYQQHSFVHWYSDSFIDLFAWNNALALTMH